MNREEAYRYARRTGKTHGLHVFDIDSVIDKIYNDFGSMSCTNCKWCKNGGEFDNDECHNTSESGHLNVGTLVADDFCCNRWESV